MQHTKTVEDWEYRVERFMWTLRGQGWIFTRNGKNSRGQANSPKNQLKDFVIKTIHTAVLAREAELREKISGMAFVDAAQAGQFAMHTDVYNQAIEEVLELLNPQAEA